MSGGIFNIDSGLVTNIGCRRRVNEDAGRIVRPIDPELFLRRGLLAVVADGMGGHSAGEVASSLAVDIVDRCYYEGDDDAAIALVRAFQIANQRVWEQGMTDAGMTGMGTTCTALALLGREAVCAHVGDSRIYLIRQGRIYVLTEDHSAVQQMVADGLLRREEARHHAEKNIVLRALGADVHLEVASWDRPFQVETGDCFLLCSDGLYNQVSDEEIRDLVDHRDAQAGCDELVARARARGGPDNITVAIVHLQPAYAQPDLPVGPFPR